MSDDIVTRLTISTEHYPSRCWSCCEWSCENAAGKPIPCPCYNWRECDCDNVCSCDCHQWYAIVNDAKAEIERLLVMCEQFASCAKSFGTEYGSDVVEFRINQKKFRKTWEKYKEVRGDR